VKENQKLHLGKDELLDENVTLSELNILPGANLWVMDTGQHENRDITGMRFSYLVMMSSILDLRFSHPCFFLLEVI